MTPIVWHIKAREDLMQSVGFYNSRSRVAARGFLDEIEQSVERISSLVELSRAGHDYFAHVNLKKYPYFVGYAVASGRIWILTVSYGRRRDRTSWTERRKSLR